MATKWLKSCTTLKEVRDKVVLEQFLDTVPDEVRVFVKEGRPATSEEAGK